MLAALRIRSGGSASIAALLTALVIVCSRPAEAQPGPPVSPAAERQLLEGRDVSYEEVLRRPDDPELNFAYARTQVRQGDILGALATLERMLLLNPNQPRVRLLYAVVLYRLNAPTEAQRELEAVMRYDMPEGLRRDLEYYHSETLRQQQATQFSLYARIGWTYDSNRNAAPISGRLDGPGYTLVAPGDEDAFGLNALLRFEVEHDLGYHRRHRLVGAATLSSDTSFESNSFSFLAGELTGGIALDFNPVELRLLPYWRASTVRGDLVQNAYGGLARLSYQTRIGWQFFLFFQGEQQDYHSESDSPDSNLRSGGEFRIGAGARYIIDRHHRVTGSVAYIRKNARAGFYVFDGVEAVLEHGWLIGRGMFLATRLSVARDTYDSADPVIDPVQLRSDTIFKIRSTFGIPIGTLTGWDDAPRPIRDAIVSLGVEYSRGRSNQAVYSYENVRVMLGLAQRFNF